jgi:hypothetical protein
VKDKAVAFVGDDADVWNRLIGPVYDLDGLERGFGFESGTIAAMSE